MTDNKNQMDFSGHLKHLEDAQNIELPTDEKTLTDSELEHAGLIKTSAFVRTKKSKNALRVQKHKDKKAQEGIKQLNIEVPEQFRDTFKQIAKQLKETGTINKVDIDSLPLKAEEKIKPSDAPESTKATLDDESVKFGKKCAEIVSRGGFKAALLKFLV